MSREAFEKWAEDKDFVIGTPAGRISLKDAAWEVWQAAQSQASKPIAAVHGWFHGECVIRALDPEAVLPAGMALYASPQAQAGEREKPYCLICGSNDGFHDGIDDTTPPAAVKAGDGEAPVAVRFGWDGEGYQYMDNGSGSDWMTRMPDAEKLYAHPAGSGEAVGVVGGYEFAKTVHFYESKTPARVGDLLYTAPPAAVNQQLLEALELCFEHCKLYHPAVLTNNVGSVVRAAIAAAQEQGK